MDFFIALLEKMMKIIIGITLSLLVFIVTYVAVMRYIFNNAPAWGESMALLCMVWFCMISSALGVKQGIHLRMTLIDNILSKRALSILEHLTNILWMTLGILAIWFGISLTKLSGNNIITGLGIPSAVIYAAVPVFGFIVVLVSLGEELKLCRHPLQ